MTKLINKMAVVLIFILGLFSLIFAQETLTITTYYPSPYGSYNTLYVAGNLGIGTTNPTAKLHIEDTLGTTERISFTSGSNHAFNDVFAALDFYNPDAENSAGAQRVVSYIRAVNTRSACVNCSYEDTGLVFGTMPTNDHVLERMRITHDGNVGIGTTGPQQQLHVASANTSTQGTIRLSSSAITDQYLDIKSPAGGINADVSSRYGLRLISDTAGAFEQGVTFIVDGTTAMYIQPNGGNVGIGTTGPGAPLEIQKAVGGGGITTFLKLDTNSTTNGDGAAIKFIASTDDTTGPMIVGVRDAAGAFSSLRFHTVGAAAPSGAERIRIDQNGNVGIGTTNPGKNLHIAKNTAASATLGGAPAVLMLEQANDTDWAAGQAAAEILFKKGGDIVGAIRSEHTRTGGVHSYEDAGLTFYVAPAAETPTAFEAMRIDYTGNVGIGTTNPGSKLDVNGNISTSGNYYDGGLDPVNAGWNVRMESGTGKFGYDASSSVRYKKNISDLDLGLNAVMKLHPVYFNYKEDYLPNAPRQIGLVAEEVAKISPMLVDYIDNKSENVKYDRLTALLVKAIQELKIENDALKKRIEKLERIMRKKES